MIAESDRQRLNSQLVVWRGPLPVDPTRDKDQFADFAEEICPNVGTIIADSVKDFAPGISDDKVGSALNLSWQEVIARDIQLMLLHHERKAPNGVKRVHSLDDVYGSTWLTSGLGSVIVLDGEPGDPTVELRHLKQPAEPVGPLTLRHDHSVGRTVLFDSRPDLLELLITAGARRQCRGGCTRDHRPRHLKNAGSREASVRPPTSPGESATDRLRADCGTRHSN